MYLAHAYANRADIPKGTENLFKPQGNLFIRQGQNLSADNPWEADVWNLTDQGRFVAEHGAVLADAFAKAAGTTVGGLKPRPAYQPNLKVLIQRRDITVGGSGVSDDALATGLATKV